MTVIDKILNEWSYRCHDGIVDMNNPKKLSILKEILVEYKILNEDIDDDILNALSRLDPNDPKKEKVLTYLAGDTDNEKDKEIERLKQQIDGTKQEKEKKANEIKDIIKTLIDKNLSKSTAWLIVGEFMNNDKEDDLISYFKNLPELKVQSETNIKKEPLERFQSKDIVNNLYDELSGAGGTKGIGKEENFLVAFYKNIKKLEGKGDIEVDGQRYEVKGVGSMVTPSSVSRGSKKNVVDLLANNFLNQLDNQISPEVFKSRKKWIATISDIYKNYSDKTEFINKLQSVLRLKYPGLVVDDKILRSEDSFSKSIAKNLIDQFDVSEGEKIMFVSPDGNIKIYNTKEDLINAINKNEIEISAFSDFVPRLTLPKEKEKTKIGVSNIKDNVKEIRGIKYVSRNWYNQQDDKIKKYFDDTKSLQNFIPLNSDYQDKIELVPYTSLEE